MTPDTLDLDRIRRHAAEFDRLWNSDPPERTAGEHAMTVAAVASATDVPVLLAALDAAEARGYHRAVEAVRGEAAQNLVAQAVCQDLLPWTRTAVDPIVDGPDYEAFMQAARNYLDVLATQLDAVAGETA